MTDIFLSYNREDQARAKVFAEAFQAQGLSVWWDVGLRTGEAYDQVTEKALNDARAVVVLWSAKSVESRWVRAEATLADRNKTLVPVMIEACKRPIMFELVQTAELSHWKGDPKDAAWLAFLADLHAFLGKERTPPPSPTPKPSAPRASLLRSPIVLGGIALAAVALVAVLAMMLLGPKPPAALQNERIAFFGFTAADTDALSAQVADVATEETRSALIALRLETAAGGETKDVAPKDQMDRAARLGARYALSGSVRTTGDQIRVTMTLDDVPTRATIWEEAQSGGRNLSVALPVQAAGRATNTLDCLISSRPGMVREDASALGIVARACDAGPVGPDAVTRWSAAVGVAPKSPGAEFGLGVAWIIQSSQATPGDRKTMLEQARQAFARAEAIEPGRPDIRAGNDLADIASHRPLAKIIEDLNSLLGVGADRTRGRRITGAVFARLTLLTSVGRAGEAARLGKADVEADPLNGGLLAAHASALLASEQTAEEGQRLQESVIRRFANISSWVELAFLVIFDRGDLGPLVATAPPGAGPELVECMQDAARAARLPDENARKAGIRRVLDCVTYPGAPQIDDAALAIAILGGDDGVTEAFKIFEGLLDRSNPVAFGTSAARLFTPHAEILRKDARFLGLVKKASIYDYWRDTGTPPEVCDLPKEYSYPVCAELRKDRAK